MIEIDLFSLTVGLTLGVIIAIMISMICNKMRWYEGYSEGYIKGMSVVGKMKKDGRMDAYKCVSDTNKGDVGEHD